MHSNETLIQIIIQYSFLNKILQYAIAYKRATNNKNINKNLL